MTWIEFRRNISRTGGSKIESLKFVNVEYGWNDLRKTCLREAENIFFSLEY